MLRGSVTFYYLVVTVFMSLTVYAAKPADQDRLPKVIGPDGKEVTEATIYQVFIAGDRSRKIKWEVKKYALKDMADFLGTKARLQQHAFDFFVVDAPGCSLGVWSGFWLSTGKDLKLEKEFFVDGSVVDADGKPVSGADVTLGKIGVSTYTSVHFNRPGAMLPCSRTRTDEQGKYRFRGMILNGYDFDMGVEVMARYKRDGVTMLGERVVSFAGDIPFFEKARGGRSYWKPGPVKLMAADEITGVVVDAKTGMPLPGAVVEASGLKYAQGASRSKKVTTDWDGRFAISGMRIDRVVIAYKWYQGGRLVAQKTWREKGHTKLKVSLRPLVEVRGKLIDTHTESAPVVSTMLSYEYSDPAGEGWSLVVDKGCKSGMSGPDPEFAVGEDGSFKHQLPVGKLNLYSNSRMLRTHRKRSEWDPYAYHFDRLVTGEEGQVLEFKLKRKPGVLFKVNVPKDKPRSSKDANDWERVVVSMRANGVSGSGSIAPRQPYGFWPVKNWGDKVNFQAELRHEKPRVKLLDKDYAANANTWPVEIDVVKLRESVR